jgi:ligand-binding sensor protein
MKLEELLPTQAWEALERELHNRSGLNACIYDRDGNRITSFAAWANGLCPQIKSSAQGVATICAVANQYFTSQAKETGQLVVGECDAGLAKFALPIVHQGEFLGTLGGCGFRFPESEVETFLIHKATGLKMEDLERESDKVAEITRQEIEELAGWLQKRLDQALMRGTA